MVYTLVIHMHAKEGKEVEETLRSKLAEAAQTYMKEAEIIGWHVMQDHEDPRKWCIVERFERPSSLETHKANPYSATFREDMKPLLERSFDIRQFNELDTK